MANVPHSTLTGTDLHESKGVATATAGQVAIADGAGAAPFGKLTHTSLQTTGNPFGAQLLHVREEQAANTATSSSLTGSTWSQCVLNTIKTNEVSGASLGSNRISLPAGTYFATISVPVNFVSAGAILYFKSRLRNITAGSTLIVTPTTGQNGTGGADAVNPIQQSSGRFTLGVTSSIEFQHWQNRGSGAFLGGATVNTGEVEIYADIMIWKVA